MRYVFKVLFAAAARIQMQALPEFEVASKVDQAPHEWVGRNQGNQQKVSGRDQGPIRLNFIPISFTQPNISSLFKF
jgi:hypothetical protein